MNGSHLLVVSHLGNQFKGPESLWLFIAMCPFDILKHIQLDPWGYMNRRPYNLQPRAHPSELPCFGNAFRYSNNKGRCRTRSKMCPVVLHFL